uniref:Protein FAR1-RELATED SEQUENCE n=1 Tax=Cajanus cajan TaxID=3821 RepID=A0A151TQY2_CAJCA|nr:Protein FAR1-RELATED SEQUENCE 5 [Cajanus cajan]
MVQRSFSHVFKRSDSFARVTNCIYDFEYEDEFLNAWGSLLDKHALHQNKWMQDFFKKEIWVLVYRRHTFSADATTQLSESFNNEAFFRCFMLEAFEGMRYKEIESNYEMNQKMPPLSMNIMLLKNARDVYTPTIFSLVHGEYEKSCNLLLSSCTQNLQLCEYEVCLFGDIRRHKVIFNSEDQSVECSCQLFQFIGMLCSFFLSFTNNPNLIIQNIIIIIIIIII